MPDLKSTANQVYSDFNVPGVSSSGEKEPIKAEIRGLWALCQQLILAIQEGGSNAYVLFETVADMNADLNHAAGTWGRVIADDGSPDGNGYYLKSGASGVGAWSFISQDPAVEAAEASEESAAAAAVSAGEAAADAAVLAGVIEDLPKAWALVTGTVTPGTYAEYSAGGIVATAGWSTTEYEVDPAVLGYRATDQITGDVTAVAVYKGAGGSYLGFEFRGTGVVVEYDREELTLPDGTETIILTAYTATGGPDAVLEAASVASEDDLTDAARASILPLQWASLYPVAELAGYMNPGTGAFTAGGPWITYEFDVDPDDAVTWRASTVASGDGTTVAVFKAAGGAFLGRGPLGPSSGYETFIDEPLTLPPTTAKVYVTKYTNSPVRLIPTLQMSILASLDPVQANANRWAGRRGVIFGTSIVAGGAPGGSFVPRLSTYLGAPIVNEGFGASMIRNGIASMRVPGDTYGWTGIGWQGAAWALMKTAAEAEDLIDNWSTKWRDGFDPDSDPPTTLSPEQEDSIRDTGFEVRLVERHLGLNRKDFYIINHGYNDWANSLVAGPTDIDLVPAVRNDRGTFIGACRALVDRIRADNPRAIILFISHYTNDSALRGPPELAEAIQFVANEAKYPFCPLHERLGWSQQLVRDAAGNPIMVDDPNDPGTDIPLNMLLEWCPDYLHPHSDPTGYANERIAEEIGAWMLAA